MFLSILFISTFLQASPLDEAYNFPEPPWKREVRVLRSSSSQVSARALADNAVREKLLAYKQICVENGGVFKGIRWISTCTSTGGHFPIWNCNGYGQANCHEQP